MENNSFLMKLTKSKIAFIVIIIAIIVSSITSNYLNNIILQEIAPEFVVKAIMLDEKPTEFILFNILDSYGIQSIFNSTKGVQISFQIHNEIRQLLSLYDTYNIEYEGNYYRLQFDISGNTGSPPSIPVPLIIFSFAISIISLIAIILIIIIIIVNALRIIRRAGLL